MFICNCQTRATISHRKTVFLSESDLMTRNKIPVAYVREWIKKFAVWRVNSKNKTQNYSSLSIYFFWTPIHLLNLSIYLFITSKKMLCLCHRNKPKLRYSSFHREKISHSEDFFIFWNKLQSLGTQSELQRDFFKIWKPTLCTAATASCVLCTGVLSGKRSLRGKEK